MASKKEIFGFCLFDFANSGYTTVIITAVYNAYFVSSIGTPFLWSLTLSLSYLLVIMVSPIAGAMADYTNSRKRFLFASYIICVVSTAVLCFGSREHVFLACAMVIGSNFGFALSENFVSSFLPGLSSRHTIGRISGYAWSFGYVGGIASLLLCLAYLSHAGYGENALRMTPLFTALFFGVFALPVFFLLKEPAAALPAPTNKTIAEAGFSRLRDTFRDIRQYRELFMFLLSFFFYTCGTATVISFAAIFAQEALQFTKKEIILLILVANITSAAGAFMFGFVQDRVGARRTLFITLFLWLSAVLGAYFVKEREGFWVVANVVGFAMGASQSASRSMVGLFAPPGKAAEFYGFWGFAGKAAALCGLFSFGIFLAFSHGDIRPAVLMTAGFFIAGIALLFLVNEQKGTVL